MKISLPERKFYPVEAVLKKDELTIPLRQWIIRDAQERATETDRSCQEKYKKASTLRKTTISYAIAKLLQHLLVNFQFEQDSPCDIRRLCAIDNFVIRVSAEQADLGWEVMGVDMINPELQLQIFTSIDASCNFFDEVHDDGFNGRTLMPNIISPYVKPGRIGDSRITIDERMLCHFFGLLLHVLFTGDDSGATKAPESLEKDEWNEGKPLAKKTSLTTCLNVRGIDCSREIFVSGSDSDKCSSEGSVQVNLLHPLSTIGYSTSLSQVMTNLVECGLGSGDSYPSLEIAIVDFCLLLEEPERFLFEEPSDGRNIQGSKQCRRLYGRTTEVRLIMDTLCRVSSRRESEAVLIAGIAGCGKTFLVESVFDAVQALDCFVVSQNFEEVPTTPPISVVISAFNELCLLVANGSTPQEICAIYESLTNEFGENFHLLARVLPNVVAMLPYWAPLLITENETDASTLANYSNLCLTLQRFMRVISRASRPVMLFFDDVQWADPISLGLVHSVLSDLNGRNSILFIGTYRDDVVSPDHIIFGLVDMLSKFSVVTSKIHLNCLTKNDVNSIVSDALGILPRLCRSFSQVVHRKTSGNPYYVLEFLRSLVHRDILKFSLRERRWIWDHSKVCEENTADNVLQLLSYNLNTISISMQTALKCASCFGIQVEKLIVKQLSGTSKYKTLLSSLDSAVEDGFMDFDGTHYRFVHDKLREAAYDLIGADCKDQYHFELGIAMHSCCAIKDNGDVLILTVDQINHGVPSLVIGTSHQQYVAKLNYEASVKLTHCTDFTSAFKYAKLAVSLLADDSWTAQYSASIKYHLQLGKSALSCGSFSDAKSALGKILDGGKCLEDKIDAYYLLVANPSFESVRTSVHVLRLLGEELPTEEPESWQINLAVQETKETFQCQFDEALLRITNPVQNNTMRIKNIIKFYGHLSIISWISAPKMHDFYTARFAQFCLNSKVHERHLALAFVGLGTCLHRLQTHESFVGYRVGKIGLMLLNRSKMEKDESCQVYLAYYRELGLLLEPIQACVDMHSRGYELGMKIGNTSLAGLHLCLAVHRKIISGANLQLLMSEIEFCLKLAKQNSLTAVEALMNIHYKNVLTLIGEHLMCQIQEIPCPEYKEIECTQEMMSALFSGYFDRVNYLSKKLEVLSNENNMKKPIDLIFASFYNGLATTMLYRNKGFKFPHPLRLISQRLLPVLEKAEECSCWNFKNKASLLRAEYLSLTSKKENAECEYMIAISAARSSRFVHEEGIACELAGMHYKHYGDVAKALNFFRQSQKCYEAWGSKLKVNQMVSAIHELSKPH